MIERSRPRSIFTFSLKSLLIMMVAVAAGCWMLDRYLSDRARFEILETNIQVEGEHLSGSLSFRCNRFNERGNIEYSDTVLWLERITDSQIESLQVGDEFKVRYRQRDLGPITKENRYVVFMVNELGIRKEEIVGFVVMNGWAEVHVRGKADSASQ